MGSARHPDEDERPDGERDAGRPADRDREEPISPWEWVTGALGLLLVVGSVGVLAREAARPDTPPDVVVRVDSVARLSGGYVVHFSARNAGRLTASAVTIEGELSGPSGDTVRAEAELDYVPGGSERRGGLYFTADPRRGRLRLRASGYQAP